MSQKAAFSLARDSLVRGYFYEPEFISEAEEAVLIANIQALPLQEAEYKQFRAKRRIKSFGGRYDFSTNRLLEAEPIAAFLHPLRECVAGWTGQSAEQFTEVLVAEYVAGTQLGWHRDVPNFELVVGISLGSACRMRFRRYPYPAGTIAGGGTCSKVDLPTGRRGALGVATQNPTDAWAAILDFVSNPATYAPPALRQLAEDIVPHRSNANLKLAHPRADRQVNLTRPGHHMASRGCRFLRTNRGRIGWPTRGSRIQGG